MCWSKSIFDFCCLKISNLTKFMYLQKKSLVFLTILLVTICFISGKCTDMTWHETGDIMTAKLKLNVNLFQLFGAQEILSLSDGSVCIMWRGQQTLPAPPTRIGVCCRRPRAATGTTGSERRERARICRYFSNVNLKIPNPSPTRCFPTDFCLYLNNSSVQLHLLFY